LLIKTNQINPAGWKIKKKGKKKVVDKEEKKSSILLLAFSV
jgi:hypothetical protein